MRAHAKKAGATKLANTASPAKPTAWNGTRPSNSASSVEDLLRAVAAEIGLGRAMEILAGERARVRRVLGDEVASRSYDPLSRDE